MAENILHDHADRLPEGVTLIPATGGVFEVTLGGRTLFSKERTGRFPEENEVEDQVAELLGTE